MYQKEKKEKKIQNQRRTHLVTEIKSKHVGYQDNEPTTAKLQQKSPVFQQRLHCIQVVNDNRIFCAFLVPWKWQQKSQIRCYVRVAKQSAVRSVQSFKLKILSQIFQIRFWKLISKIVEKKPGVFLCFFFFVWCKISMFFLRSVLWRCVSFPAFFFWVLRPSFWLVSCATTSRTIPMTTDFTIFFHISKWKFQSLINKTRSQSTNNLVLSEIHEIFVLRKGAKPEVYSPCFCTTQRHKV